jgi:hypothetical protein
MTQTRTWVFATSNNITTIIAPLRSRFFTVKIEPYTYEQFYQITVQLLTKQHKVKEEIAEATANAIWDKSANIRDCVKIGRIAKSIEDDYCRYFSKVYSVQFTRAERQIKKLLA